MSHHDPYTQKLKFKGYLVQKIDWKQTDRWTRGGGSDLFIFLAKT